MRVVEGTEQRFLLVIAPELAHRTLREQLLVKLVPVFESGWAHSRRRTNRIGGLFRIRNVERTVFTPQEPRGRERLEFLAFAQVEALADVDERRHCLILRPQRARDDRADVRRRHGLRRRVTCVPLVLVPRMENEPKVARCVAANQRAAVHHAGDPFQTGGKLDVIDGRVNRRKRAEHFGRFHAALKRRVTFRVERLRVRHTAGQPEHNQRVGGRFDLFLGFGREQGARITRGQRRQRSRAGRLHKITSVRFHRHHLNKSIETRATSSLPTTNPPRLPFSPACRPFLRRGAILLSSAAAPAPAHKA